MYATALDELKISPHRMRFQNLWIYQLRSFHPFWIQKIKSEYENELFFGKTAWGSLLQIYNLNLFTPIEKLHAFAEDYHSQFHPEISSAQIQKIFEKLNHLGISKIGHLVKIPGTQIQNRWGKKWADFFRGVLQPEDQDWPWQPQAEDPIFSKKIDLEFSIFDAEIFFNYVGQALDDLNLKISNISFQSISIKYPGAAHEDDIEIQIEFPKKTSLQRDMFWIKRIVHDKILSLHGLSPISQFEILIYASPPSKQIQLSFFEDRSSSEKFDRMIKKIECLGCTIFQPEKSLNPKPEKSWKPKKAKWQFAWQSEALFRPLIQFSPRPIPRPQGVLYPTETLQWTDENEKIQSRHYFMMRSERKWAWVFRDHCENWFEQGILE